MGSTSGWSVGTATVAGCQTYGGTHLGGVAVTAGNAIPALLVMYHAPNTPGECGVIDPLEPFLSKSKWSMPDPCTHHGGRNDPGISENWDSQDQLSQVMFTDVGQDAYAFSTDGDNTDKTSGFCQSRQTQYRGFKYGDNGQMTAGADISFDPAMP